MGFQNTYGFEEELFLIGRRWLSYFSEHTGQAKYVRVRSKAPIKQKQKTFKQNYSEERVERRKHPQTLLTQELLKKKRKNKQKVYR